MELPELQPQLPAPLQSLYTTLLRLLPLLPATADPAAAAAALHAHLRKLQAMWQFMGRQAKGVPTGAHAAFKRLGVDAATLRVLTRNDDGLLLGPVGYAGGWVLFCLCVRVSRAWLQVEAQLENSQGKSARKMSFVVNRSSWNE